MEDCNTPIIAKIDNEAPSFDMPMCQVLEKLDIILMEKLENLLLKNKVCI